MTRDRGHRPRALGHQGEGGRAAGLLVARRPHTERRPGLRACRRRDARGASRRRPTQDRGGLPRRSRPGRRSGQEASYRHQLGLTASCIRSRSRRRRPAPAAREGLRSTGITPQCPSHARVPPLRARRHGQLCHDVHGRLTPGEAARLARHVEPYRLLFLKDPVRAEHRESLRLVRRASTTSPRHGRALTRRSTTRSRLITEQLIDYIRCDLRPHRRADGSPQDCSGSPSRSASERRGTGPNDIGLRLTLRTSISTAPSRTSESRSTRSDRRRARCAARRPGSSSTATCCRRRTPGLGVDIDETLAAEVPVRACLPPDRQADGRERPRLVTCTVR